MSLSANEYLGPLLTLVSTSRTNDINIIPRDRDVLKFSSVYLSVYALVPCILAPLVHFLVPYSPRSILNRDRAKYMPLLICYISLLIGMELVLRCASNFRGTSAATGGKMVWYAQRPAFYLTTPMLELLAIVVIIPFDLPHAFGGSNAPVLEAINRRAALLENGGLGEKEDRQHEDAKDTVDSAEERSRGGKNAPEHLTVAQALRATTPNYKPGFWTTVQPEDDADIASPVTTLELA